MKLNLAVAIATTPSADDLHPAFDSHRGDGAGAPEGPAVPTGRARPGNAVVPGEVGECLRNAALCEIGRRCDSGRNQIFWKASLPTPSHWLTRQTTGRRCRNETVRENFRLGGSAQRGRAAKPMPGNTVAWRMRSIEMR
jgi:hypothetical protein